MLAGAALSVDFPPKLAGGAELSLPGRVLRENPVSGSGRHLVAVGFTDIDPGALELLDSILEGKVIGTLVTRLGEGLSEDTASLTVEVVPEPRVMTTLISGVLWLRLLARRKARRCCMNQNTAAAPPRP